MQLALTEEESAFREEMRTFFTTKIPQELRDTIAAGRHLGKEGIVESQRIMNEAGIAVPNWPVEWGGQDWTPLQKHQISMSTALKRGEEPLREFMFKQTREKDIALFANLAHLKNVKTRKDIPTQVLIPAFTISELKTSFQIGFLIFLPFLIIDLVISSTLMSMGMMMLPPVFISLPFKILLFVLVDGWDLITQSLIASFHH